MPAVNREETVCSAQFNSLTQVPGKDICKNAQSPLPHTCPNSLAIPHTSMVDWDTGFHYEKAHKEREHLS